MVYYLTWQIERGENGGLNYTAVFAKKFFAPYKEQVDTMLTADGYTVGDDGWAVKTSAETTAE